MAQVEIALVLVLLAVAMILRTYRLGAPTLTGDEWFMLRNAHEGPSWIIHQARTFEPHPLLYYVGFWGWVNLTGQAEWSMRFPSVAFGLVSCVAIWRILRTIVGANVALIGLSLVVLNPYQVAQSQNARNYAMVAALATVATLLVLRAARQNSDRHWYFYAVGLLLALHTHLNAILIGVAHALWAMGKSALSQKAISQPMLRAGALIALLFLPWLFYAEPALTAYQGFYPEKVGIVEVAIRTLTTFVFGQWSQPRRLYIAVAGILAIVGAVALVSSNRRSSRAEGALLVLTAAIPVVGTAIVFLFRPMFEERYLIVAAPVTLAIIAVAIAIPDRWIRGLSLIPFFTLIYVSVPLLRLQYDAIELSRPDWRGLASWIAGSAGPGDRVVIEGHGVADAYGYYGVASAPVDVFAEISGLDSDLDRMIAAQPSGVFYLPAIDSPTERRIQDRLSSIGFAGENRWFRNQRGQYFGLPVPGDPPPSAVDAEWGGSIRLVDAVIAPGVVRPEENVRIGLRWQASERSPNLKMSVRLIASDGKQLAQLDRQPANETSPFPSMRGNVPQWDGHALTVPRQIASSGPISAAILLYQPDNAKAVTPDRGGGYQGNPDLVLLGSIELGSPRP